MMTLVVVPFVLGLAVTAQTGPSAAELERAHRLLAGTWDVLDMVDDGETLSRDLIRSKLAGGGADSGRRPVVRDHQPGNRRGQDNGVQDRPIAEPAPDRRDLARRPDLARNLSL